MSRLVFLTYLGGTIAVDPLWPCRVERRIVCAHEVSVGKVCEVWLDGHWRLAKRILSAYLGLLSREEHGSTG